MNAVRINHNERTIVITKKYAKLASVYDNTEYRQLEEIKKVYPNYQVIVREVSKKSSVSSRLTLRTMENYIKMHDDDGKIMEEFKKMRDEKAGENLEKTSFFEIKKWFFATYPELKKTI